MADLVVVTAAATVYLADGSVTLLYKGATLPASSDLAEGEAKRLKDGGFVDTAEAPKVPAAKKAAAPKETAAQKKAREKAEAEQAAADAKAAEEASEAEQGE